MSVFSNASTARLLIACLTAAANWGVPADAACADRQKNQRTLVDELGVMPDFELNLTACPIEKARIRRPDNLASEGGDFYSQRGSSSCHFALDLEFVPGDVVQTQYGLGKPVSAASAGTVVLAQKNWGAAGHTVIIDHGGNLYSLYAHLDALETGNGSKVKAGQRLGTIGYSGNAQALEAKSLPPHLHFQVFKTLKPISQWKPLEIVKEYEHVDDQVPHMEGLGFVDPTNRLRTLGCLK
jgi:hypothetical protein